MNQVWRARTRRGVETVAINGVTFYLIGPVHPAHGTQFGTRGEIEGLLRAHGGDGTYVPAALMSGEFHPRIWRGIESPSPDDAGYGAEWIASVRVARLLYARLHDVFASIEPVRTHDPVYGLAQRELLLLACTEVESSWKAILTANGASSLHGAGRWTTKDYVRLIAPLRLTE
jgi:hypothetical protein